MFIASLHLNLVNFSSDYEPLKHILKNRLFMLVWLPFYANKCYLGEVSVEMFFFLRPIMSGLFLFYLVYDMGNYR